MALRAFETSSESYQPTVRDYEVGRVLIRSFPVPNPTGKAAGDSSPHADQDIHPAKALYALAMLANVATANGRVLGIEEIRF
jgi:hypothetical protein